MDAAQEINNKAQDMSDEAEANNELTTEEKEALTERIDNDKNEILSKIDDQTTDEGVEQVKNTGLTTLAADTPQPVIKPKAREAINNKVTDQKALINQNNEATHEEKNVAIQKVDNHSSESLQKLVRLKQRVLLMQREMRVLITFLRTFQTLNKKPKLEE